jgi:hypothetical protein
MPTLFMLHEIGPSGVRALPLAAGINVGGHYFRYFFPLFPQPVLQGRRAVSTGRNSGLDGGAV